jgi:hypothetical protein
MKEGRKEGRLKRRKEERKDGRNVWEVRTPWPFP